MKKYYLSLGFMGLIAIPVVTLVSCSDSKSKSLKFSFSDEKAKFNDVVSRKTAKELSSDVNSVTPSAAQLGFDEPTLSDGATATYSIVDAVFTDGDDKVVTVTLTHGKETNTVNFNLRPKFDFSGDIAKFIDSTSTKTAAQLSSSVISTNPTPEQLGFTQPADLSTGTTATYSIVDQTFIGTDAKAVTVTLTHGEETTVTTFNLRPKATNFDFSVDIAKFIDAVSSKTATELSTSVDSTTPSAFQLGFTEPPLIDGVIATYEIVDQTFIGIDAKAVTVTLTHGEETTVTTFNLRPKVTNFDFSVDIAKFIDAVSSKTATELSTSVDSTTPSAFQLGFTEPPLIDGVIAAYSIVDQTFIGTDAKAVTVTLTHGEETIATTFNLRPKFDFSSEVIKFTDAVSSKTATELSTSVDSTTPSAFQLGFTEPPLIDGVIATYSIVDQTFIGTDAKAVTVTLTHGEETTATTFNLRPKATNFDFSGDIAKFIDSTSTKTAAQLSSSVISTNPTPDALGFTQPADLSTGTTATYSIVDQTFIGTDAKAVTVTLTHGEETVKTTFNLRPKFDFSADKAKFVNSNSNKNSIQLRNDIFFNNPTAKQLGYTEPILTNGVTATYDILGSFIFSPNVAKVITVTLHYGKETDKVTFELTPLYNVAEKQKELTDLVLPTENKLITGSTQSTGITTYAEAKKLFDAAKAFVTSTTDSELDTAIINAKVAIEEAKAYNQKVLEANSGLKLVGDTQTLLDGSDINVIRYGYFIGGAGGKFDILDSHGQKVAGWTTKTLFSGSNINGFAESQDAMLVVGDDGKIGFWDKSSANGAGPLIIDASITTLFDGANINAVITEHFLRKFALIGGDGGKVAYIGLGLRKFEDGTLHNYNVLGGSDVSVMVPGPNFFSSRSAWVASNDGKIQYVNFETGHTENIIQLFADKSAINSMISDGHNGFWVGGAGGKLEHIDANGQKVAGWTTKILLDGSDINSIISDLHGGFWVGGAGGKLDHIDANGQKVADWTTKTLLDGNDINSIIERNGQFWVGGAGGKLVSFLYTPPKN